MGDHKTIPIPREIEDLDQFVDEATFVVRELTPEEINKYTPYVAELVAKIDGTWQLKDLDHELIRLRRKYRLNPSKCHMLDTYRHGRSHDIFRQNVFFERLIRKKMNRSTSGVVVITMLLGPGKFSCPMNCHYCPNDPAIARSYLLKEPAVRRGFLNDWDPYRQFNDRANSLYRAGHQITKIEIIIEGGTFGSYPHDYIETYFRDIYYAANTYGQPQPRERLSLKEEIEINQSAHCAIIGITIGSIVVKSFAFANWV